MYQLFNLTLECTYQELKKAYHTLSLQYHPDKQIGKSDDEIAENRTRFQELSEAFDVLRDPVRRELYNNTGEKAIRETVIDWKEYFATRFEALTAERIDEFEKKFRYSDAERVEVLAAYTKTKGDLLLMIELITSSQLSDIKRFQVICEGAIAKGEMEKYKGFPKVNQRELKKRIAEAQDEAILAGLGGGLEHLEDLIKEKGKERQTKLMKVLDKGEVMDNEPSEAEFLALQQKMFSKRDADEPKEIPNPKKSKVVKGKVLKEAAVKAKVLKEKVVKEKAVKVAKDKVIKPLREKIVKEKPAKEKAVKEGVKEKQAVKENASIPTVPEIACSVPKVGASTPRVRTSAPVVGKSKKVVSEVVKANIPKITKTT